MSMDSCLELLRGKSDEEKFAGLLVVAKQLNLEANSDAKQVASVEPQTGPSDANDEDCASNDDHATVKSETNERGSLEEQTDMLYKIYEAVGFTFLKRLITSSKQHESPNTFQALGLNVISSLTRNPQVACEFLPLVPNFLLILRQSTEDKEEQVEMEDECHASKGTPTKKVNKNMQEVLQDTLSILYHILKFVGQTSDAASKCSPLLFRPESFLTLARVIAQAPIPVISETGAFALRELVQLHSSKLEVSEQLVQTLAPVFSAGHSSAQLTLLSPLSLVCHQLLRENQTIYSNAPTMPDWALDVRQGLYHILTNRMHDTERQHALLVSQLFVHTFGEAWLMAEYKEIGGGKFAEVLFSTVSVETRVLFMEAGQPSVYGDKDLRNATITACFSMVLSLLGFLVDDSTGLEYAQVKDLPSERLLVFKTRFDEVIGAILQYFRDLDEHGIHASQLLVPGLQLLIALLTEDGSSCPSCVPLVPFILQIRTQPDAEDATSRTSVDPHLVRMILPFLCQLVTVCGDSTKPSQNSLDEDKSKLSQIDEDKMNTEGKASSVDKIVQVLQGCLLPQALIDLLATELRAVKEWFTRNKDIDSKKGTKTGKSKQKPRSKVQRGKSNAAETDIEASVGSNVSFPVGRETLQLIGCAAELLFVLSAPSQLSVLPEQGGACSEHAQAVRSLLVQNASSHRELASLLRDAVSADTSDLQLSEAAAAFLPLLILTSLLKPVAQSTDSASSVSQSLDHLIIQLPNLRLFKSPRWMQKSILHVLESFQPGSKHWYTLIEPKLDEMGISSKSDYFCRAAQVLLQEYSSFYEK
eukprot:g55494.t1